MAGNYRYIWDWGPEHSCEIIAAPGPNRSCNCECGRTYQAYYMKMGRNVWWEWRDAQTQTKPNHKYRVKPVEPINIESIFNSIGDFGDIL